jgi:hypothetical protein
LNLDWGLRDVRIVVEDVVVMDLVDDAVEGIRVNMYPSPVLTKVAGTPMVEEIELQCLLDNRILV